MNTPFVTADLGPEISGAGASGPFSSQLLAPPFRTPYLIREIRFFSFVKSTGGGGAASAKYLQVNLSVGHRALTNGFVPLSLLCPQVQLATDETSSIIHLATSSIGYYRWILPRPMYCRPGEGLEGSVLTANGSTAQQVEVSVVGEVLPAGAPVPKTSAVPYASAYSTTSSASVSAGASNSLQLQNPWTDRILNMQRFVGRGYLNSAGAWTDADITDANSPLVSLSDWTAQTQILPVQGVRFGEAFDARTSCLEHRRPLQPKGFFAARLWNIPANSVYWISMIGWREEAVQ